MNALEMLREAFEKMKEAEQLVKDARQSNESLDDYYGYSLRIIEQELNSFSDNSNGYSGGNTPLSDIIEGAGVNWEIEETETQGK
jgi:hypothetical protein